MNVLETEVGDRDPRLKAYYDAGAAGGGKRRLWGVTPPDSANNVKEDDKRPRGLTRNSRPSHGGARSQGLVSRNPARPDSSASLPQAKLSAHLPQGTGTETDTRAAAGDLQISLRPARRTRFLKATATRNHPAGPPLSRRALRPSMRSAARPARLLLTGLQTAALGWERRWEKLEGESP